MVLAGLTGTFSTSASSRRRPGAVVAVVGFFTGALVVAAEAGLALGAALVLAGLTGTFSTSAVASAAVAASKTVAARRNVQRDMVAAFCGVGLSSVVADQAVNRTTELGDARGVMARG